MTESTSRKKTTLIGAGSVLTAGVCIGLLFILRPATEQRTDDAFVSADFTLVSARVAGQIATLDVTDNQTVEKGQVLAQIDDRDYAAALASAEANVASAQARIAQVNADMIEQQALIDQSIAGLSASKAAYVFAKADFDRYADLAKQGAGTQQNAEQARSRIDAAHAKVAGDTAGVRAAQQRTAVLLAQRMHASSELQQAEAARDAARLNLSYTRIIAPVDGTVGQRAVRVGAYVTPGSPLLAVVPLSDAYVLANFQETQLTQVHPGQEADIRVDTFPGRVLHGRVDSIAPATGVTFSALAPDNATGNFTKVVQRIPVKIVLTQSDSAALRVGMSVDATINTRLQDKDSNKSKLAASAFEVSKR